MENANCVAVGKIPSGLFIISVQDPETKIIDGYLASWVQQVSFDPLLVSLAIQPNRPIYDSIVKRALPFTINIVGTNNKSYLRYFWKGYSPTENPFEQKLIEYESTPAGGVALLESVGYIDAVCVQNYTPGDHTLVVAKVIGQDVYRKELIRSPVIHLRNSGLQY